MKKNDLIKYSACGMLAWGTVSSFAAPEVAKPNVLFIAVDDLNDFVGVLKGNVDVKTPNLDRLAEYSVTFTNTHCQSPMCAPSRASLLTGIRPSTSGNYGFQNMWDNDVLKSARTIPHQFRMNGYKTMGVGKINHNSNLNARGGVKKWEYDKRKSFPKPYLSGKVHEKNLSQINKKFRWGPSYESDKEMTDYKIADWACEKLKKKYNKPFFLAVGFYRPHTPLFAPEKYFDMYPLDKLSAVNIKEDDLDDIPLAGKFWSFLKKDYLIRKGQNSKKILQAYLACVTFVDAQIGRVLDALKKSPYANNTIIVLWSDHGWHLGEKHHWTKFSLWNEATISPLMISAPGMQKGALCNRAVELLDIYPTLVDLCNIPPPPQKLEGHSLKPLLKKPNAKRQWPAISTLGKNNHAISLDNMKYIRYFDGSEELYNHIADPNEWNNLAKNPEYAEQKKNLAKWLPKINAPNAPGTSLKRYFSSDTWDLNAKKSKIEKLEKAIKELNK
jgi:iduronate 2-sulfatase